MFKNASPKTSTSIHTFDHTVKPILLYASEVWGIFDENKFVRASVFNDLQIEKHTIKFCKYILGMNKKASNLLVRDDLGRNPFYIDVIITMLKYWLHLHTIDSSQARLLSQALNENYLTFNNNQSRWLHCIY